MHTEQFLKSDGMLSKINSGRPDSEETGFQSNTKQETKREIELL